MPDFDGPRYTRDARSVIDAELLHLRKHRPAIADPATPLVGLALSGGGIRSAAFALGALHALNRFDLLRHVDYMSTVSGGGYCGTSLTWTLSTLDKSNLDPQPTGEIPDEKPDGFPLAGWRQGVFGTHRAKPPTADAFPFRRLDAIRRRGNYLTPGHFPSEMVSDSPAQVGREDHRGLSALSAVAIVLRGSMLATLVYGSAAAMVILGLLLVAIQPEVQSQLARIVAQMPLTLYPMQDPGLAWAKFFTVLALVPGALMIAAFFPGMARLFGSHVVAGGSEHRRRARYQWRIGRYLFLVVGALILATLPMAPGWLMAAAVGGGTAAGLLRFAGKNVVVPALRALPTGMIVGVGGGLLCYGLLALVYDGVRRITEPEPLVHPATAFAAGVAVLFIAWFCRTNYLTPHRMYRDRLMEAFMPSPLAKLLRPCWARQTKLRLPAMELFSPDRRMLAHMCGAHPDWNIDPAADGRYPGPFHLINANVVLTGSRDDSRRGRGGDNFVMTPLHVGSNATGWRTTRDYALPPSGVDSVRRPVITLATAMAISGAAVNPNGWAGDEGPTRNPFVAFLMTILNLRLGYDIPNPDDRVFREGDTHQPNLLSPGLLRLFGAHTDERSRFVEITDGGHFENLGLYELFRRECKLVICTDAGADPDFAFGDLTRALERARVDFGVNVKFLKAAHLRDVIPPRTPSGPAHDGCAASGFAIARIEYPPEHLDGTNEPIGAARQGLLVYIKSTLLEDLPVDLLGYRALNAAFPHQATTDQFFTEGQFEAYRELGYQLTKRSIQSPQLDGVFAALRARGRKGLATRIEIAASGAT